MRITIAAVAIAAVVNSAAFAGDTMGAGMMTCAEVTELYRVSQTQADIHASDLLVGSWSSGFMSAINYSRNTQNMDTKNLGSMTFENQVIAIRRYCKHHPDKLVIDGVGDLFESLSSNVDAPVNQARRDFR